MTKPMDFSILQLKIHRFAGIGEMTVPFRDNAVNIIYGENRSGKTSVCECIRFLLYGLSSPDTMLPWEGDGRISAEMELRWGERKCRLVRTFDNGKETVLLTDLSTKETIPITTSPGEMFTGLSDWMYIRTLYFAQKKTDNIQKDLDSTALDRLTAPLTGEKDLYSRYEQLLIKRNSLMNSDKSGKIDLLLEKKNEYELRREAFRTESEEIEKIEKKLASITAAIEENNPKTVLLKANMKNLSDEIKSLQQTEQFASLHATLSSDEAKYQRMLAAARINGVFPDPKQVENIRTQYQNLTVASEQLGVEKERLIQAKNNLNVHNALIDNNEDDIDVLVKKYRSASSRSRICIYFSLFSFIFAALCAFFIDDLFLSRFGKEDRYFLGYWLAGCGIIAGFILLTRFFIHRSRMRMYLDEAGADTPGELQTLRSQKTARRQSALLYANELNKQESVTRAAQKKHTELLRALRELLSFACEETVPVDTLLFTARTILESASALSALEKKLSEERRQYRDAMEGNAGKDFLSMQNEFARMEDELNKIHDQTQQMMDEKGKLSVLLDEKKKLTVPEKAALLDMQAQERELLDLLELYRAIQSEAEIQRQKINTFEEEFKLPICSYINSFLTFTMRKDESFLLGKKLELLYKRGGTVSPVYTAGGGLSELAIIALRLSYIEQLQGNCAPLLFDEAFAYVDRQSLSHLYAALTNRQHRQILIFSSSQHEKSALPKNVNLLRLLRDPT